jgi:formiminoglutamase
LLPNLDASQLGVAILGFASDEGVVRNLGRVGAAEGPAALRQFCAGFPVHFDPKKVVLADLGTVVCQDGRLEEAQALLGGEIEKSQAKGYRTLLFGGGHEITYGHWLGIQPTLNANQTAGIVNFDAHYDLRYLDNGRHSGNSFSGMSADCEADGRPFAYAALGIQAMGNTQRLFHKAKELGVITVLAEDIGGPAQPDSLAQLSAFLADQQPQMLTMDLDVFSASLAPGVSAPNALGLLPRSGFMQLLKRVLLTPSLRSVDIAELNPRYDVDHRTARLAAALAFEVVQAWTSN